MNVSQAQRPPRFLHILLLGVALWGGEYARRGLWEPDEARCAYIAGEMSRTGQWAVPHRHGEPYAHKPPLMYWLINLGSLAAGGRITRVTARLPSLLGATLSLWCTARLAGRWWGPAAAWRSAPILASTYLFWHEGGMGRMDALLCGLEMGALCCLFESHDARPFRRRAGAYALMGLAVLAKGPVGFLVPAGVYAAGTWAAGEGRRLRSWHWLWGPLVTLAFPAAWLIWARLAGAPGAYFREILYSQNVERAAGAWGHVQSPLYFLWHFPLDFLPWTPLLPAAWAALRGRPDATPLRRRLLAWALVAIGVFSLSPSKRSVYILAAFPAGALLIAAAWEHLCAKRHAAAAYAAAALAAAAGLAALAAPWFAPPAVDVRPLIPLGAGSIAGAVALAWLFRRRGFSTAWFAAAAGLFLAAEAYVGAAVYPAINPVKTPVELAAAAPRVLSPGQPLLLYRMQGEIMALYAGVQGRRADDPEELQRETRRWPRGIVVLDHEGWPELNARFGGFLKPHPFRMGGKSLVWCEWGSN